jgi:hypothetical protein
MQDERPDFPTMEQVEKANHEQLARLYRFLPSGDTKEQQKIFKKLGGMTPAMEKKIGYGERLFGPCAARIVGMMWDFTIMEQVH